MYPKKYRQIIRKGYGPSTLSKNIPFSGRAGFNQPYPTKPQTFMKIFVLRTPSPSGPSLLSEPRLDSNQGPVYDVFASAKGVNEENIDGSLGESTKIDTPPKKYTFCLSISSKSTFSAVSVLALFFDEEERSGHKFVFRGAKFDAEIESGFGSVGLGRGSALCTTGYEAIPVIFGIEP